MTVLALVNPLICGAMFAEIEAGQASATRLADATNAALAVLVIQVVAALLGARLLQVFGVSLEAFSIAGGGVLIWIGFSMLRGGSPQAQDAPKDHADRETIAQARDPVRGESRHDYRTRHARRRPFEARSAGHGTRRGRSRRGRNADRDGARGSGGNSPKRRRCQAGIGCTAPRHV